MRLFCTINSFIVLLSKRFANDIFIAQAHPQSAGRRMEGDYDTDFQSPRLRAPLNKINSILQLCQSAGRFRKLSDNK